MEETTLSGQHGTTFQTVPTKLRSPFGWKAALLLGLAIVCVVVFVFLSRATTPPPTTPTEQAARRASRIGPQEQAFLDSIARELIAEGKLTPYSPGSPEAQIQKPAAPMTPAERVKHYEDAVNTLLN
ncbi:MAG: hypothetical protein F8N36_08470 [Desulfovibrio sp.]|uniref:hypothetical protein n=1 Tax=Desulfovibrio sp. TaxID=885 RepID=UPI00135D45CE|nr:hypothetical protein [Desulfovibrio sp.]MTJ92879.1 hypothetical protein [Desulfovibrio sp.]